MEDRRYKNLTLLHSNDMHGDFLAESVDDKLIGGVSLLSGYVNKVRREVPNTLYCIAGDMFRGSVIDSEYRGFSTIEIANMLSPDVATIGNHEIDYGISHLLLLEKCASFPIINANLYIKNNGVRLFRPYKIIEIDGMKILFIGVLTEQVMDDARKEGLVASFIDVDDAAKEIEKICDAFNATDIDFTVLLTHIGIDADRELASKLSPECGVDIIIGGHSHTFMDEPEEINNILIVQAGTGTDQIGRFDIVVDTENNCIDSYEWKAVPIDDAHCEKDERMEKLITSLKKEVDVKYLRTLAHFNKVATHPHRNMTTQLGCLVADMFKDALNVDLFILGSAMIKVKELGPVVTLEDLTRAYGSNDPLYELTVTGKQLRRMIEYFMAKEPWKEEEITYFQFSGDIKLVYSKAEHRLTTFELDGAPITDDRRIKVATLKYYWVNLEKKLGITQSELEANAAPRIVAASDRNLLDEYMSANGRFDVPDTDRFIVE